MLLAQTPWAVEGGCFLSFLALVLVAEVVSKFMSLLEPSAGEALPSPAACGSCCLCCLQLNPRSVLGREVITSSIRCPNLKASPLPKHGVPLPGLWGQILSIEISHTGNPTFLQFSFFFPFTHKNLSPFGGLQNLWLNIRVRYNGP